MEAPRLHSLPPARDGHPSTTPYQHNRPEEAAAAILRPDAAAAVSSGRLQEVERLRWELLLEEEDDARLLLRIVSCYYPLPDHEHVTSAWSSAYCIRSRRK